MTIIASADLTTWGTLPATADASQIAWAVAAANDEVRSHCHREFVPKVATGSVAARVFRPESTVRVDVDDFWSVTNLVVKSDDDDDGTYETTWTIDTDFVLEPFNGVVEGLAGWPWTTVRAVGTRTFTTGYRPTVQVTAAWGWAAVPAPVTQATLLLAYKNLERRNAALGVAGFDSFGPIRVYEDRDVERLLRRYVIRPAVFG